jgi:hypothetical protein
MAYPIYTTTVEQHTGNHADGTRYTRLFEVRTDLTAFAREPWDALSEADREWWHRVTLEHHNVDVRLAGLDADARGPIGEAVADIDCDLEDWARLAMAEIGRRLRDVG